MPKKVKCTECATNGEKKCFSCEKVGCSKCIITVCCDCGVRMCVLCKDNHNVQCGCYGECTECNNDVNRGDNGWPCTTCAQWLCEDCEPTKWNKSCEECKSNHDE
jgi:hypothetical protein